MHQAVQQVVHQTVQQAVQQEVHQARQQMVQQTVHQDWQEKVKLNHVWKEKFDQYGQHPELKL